MSRRGPFAVPGGEQSFIAPEPGTTPLQLSASQATMVIVVIAVWL
ncbi:MAG TPA: hypothetical protein PKC45_06985 [Gemmatales bacterium]|nr:hypothetical protein [Gemmatales bacterium]